MASQGNKLFKLSGESYPIDIIKSNSVVNENFIDTLLCLGCWLENDSYEIEMLAQIDEPKIKTHLNAFRNRYFKSMKIQKESIRNQNQWQLLISLAKEIQREKSKYLVKINTNSVEFEMLKTDFEQLQDKINNIIKPEEVDTCDLSNKFEFQCIKYIQIVHAKKIDKLNHECMKDLNLKDDSFNLKLDDSNKTYSLKIVSDQFYLNKYIDLINTFSKTKICAYFEFDSKLVQHIFNEARVKDDLESIEKKAKCAIIPVELTIGSNFDYKLIAVDWNTANVDSYDQIEYVYFSENDQLTSHRLLIQKMDEIFNKMSNMSNQSKFAIFFIDTEDILLNAFVFMFREYMTDSRDRVKVNRIDLIYSDKKVLEEVINSSERTIFIEGTKLIEVKYGSLVDESLHVDVIVNSVGKDLNLNNGAISKAILNAAGSNILQELNDKYPNKLNETNKFLAVSSAGNLVNKKLIIHASLVEWDPEDELKSVEKLKQLILNILCLVDEFEMSSVAFPALGTGILKYPRDLVCETLFMSVKEYFKNLKRSTTIRNVYFIVHQSDKDNITAFKNYEKYNNETGALKLISDRVENVKKSKQKLISIKNREFVEFEHEHFIEFSQEDRQYLNKSLQTLNFRVKWNVKNNKVILIGPNRNQSEAINKFNEYTNKKLKIKKTAEKIQWAYNENNSWRAFTDQLNFELETKFIHKTDSDYIIKSKDNKNQDFTANLKENTIYFENENEKFKIRRKNLEMANIKISIPENWSSECKRDLVHLNPNDQEYLEIQEFTLQKGLRGILNNIISIQRVQNINLFSKYCTFKNELKIKYNRETTELCVFHGTSKDTVDKIWKDGFNRSYAGKNGTKYGKGVYFARDSSYSHEFTDLKRNSNQGHMFISKIVLGEISVGTEQTIVPPDNKDTTVDNVNDPSIYVIYKDEQAYPEYLLTYQ